MTKLPLTLNYTIYKLGAKVTAVGGLAIFISGIMFAFMMTAAGENLPANHWLSFTKESWAQALQTQLVVLMPMSVAMILLASAVHAAMRTAVNELNHDQMLVDLEQMVPAFIGRVLDKTYAGSAKILYFNKVLSDFGREHPKVRRETAEMVAALTVIANTEIQPLYDNLVQLDNLLESGSRECVKIEAGNEEARTQLPSLALRFRELSARHASAHDERRELIRAFEEYLQALYAHENEQTSNVTILHAGE